MDFIHCDIFIYINVSSNFPIPFYLAFPFPGPLLSGYFFCCSVFTCKRKHDHLLFCVRLPSFNMMLSVSIHFLQTTWFHFSLFISLCSYLIFFSLSHIGGHISWFPILALMNNNKNEYIFFCLLTSFPFDNYAIVE